MKIGILTQYSNSKNYGGLLQAYALTKFLNNAVPESTMQVPYSRKVPTRVLNKQQISLITRIKNKSLTEIISIIKYRIVSFINKKNNKLILQEIENKLAIRKELCRKFELSIPHSSDIDYTNETISNVNSEFDVFITGSDQVWNPNWFYSPFYLDFAAKDKTKISYAASMAVNQLSQNEKETIIPLIKELDHISVREKTAKDILQDEINKDISVVVDPVLLLDKNQWSNVAKSPLKSNKYAYAYLLGEKKSNRDISMRISKVLNIPLATVPYVHMWHNGYDNSFGDIKVNDVGPEEFIGLIRNSEIVITDSFHATVFSIIFEKKFIVVKRSSDNEKVSMNSRITDLLSELKLNDRIVENQSQIKEELLNKEIDYAYVHNIIKEKRIKSMEFLANAFSGSEMEENILTIIENIR